MEIVFTFSNTHGALAGEQALISGGVKVRVMPLPSSLGAGCGLCLRVDPGDLETSGRLLAQAGLQPEGVFTKVAKAADGGPAVYRPVGPAAGGSI